MFRRLIQTVVAVAALAAFTSVAFAAFGGGGGAGKFAATFGTRAVRDAAIDFCRVLGPGGQKMEGSYEGTMTIDGEEFAFNFTTLEILFDRETGAGTAEGTWQLGDPPTEADPPTELTGRGQLLAVVAGDPPSEANPPEPDLELRGMLVGFAQPPEPDLPAQQLLANFTASLSDGALNFTTVGDPGTRLTPAVEGVLLPAVKC